MNAILEMEKAFELRYKEDLTPILISNFINELYKPYTLVFNNHEHYKEYRSKLPRYSYGDERDKASENGWNKNGIIYVIPEPQDEERDKIVAFLIIEDKRSKLNKIRRLQYELYSKKTERKGLDTFNEIKNEIDDLFCDVLDIEESSTSNKFDTKTTQMQHIKKDFPFYCQIGALFAQGFIKEINNEFCYQEECFSSARKVALHIKNDVLNTKKNVRQIISDTIKNGKGQKNMYNNKTQMKKTIDYCKHNDLKIVEVFLNKYEVFKKN